MSLRERQPGPGPWTFIALGVLAWALIALAYASLAPSRNLPLIFHNIHVEHFAAFYTVTLLSSIALPITPLRRIALLLILIAAALAALRLSALVNKAFYIEDFACDLAGVAAALAPVFVGRYRQRKFAEAN